MSVKTRIGSALALLRLLLLYAIFCYWVALAGLWLREWRVHGQNLDRVPIDSSNPAANPPFLGITIQLENQSPAQRQQSLDRLRASGFGWVRQRIDWGEIETSKGRFDWEQTDAMLDAITANQLAPLIVLDGSPAWARRSSDQSPTTASVAPPADPRDFAHFAAQVAKRYGNRVRYYQLWDEPNIAPHWGTRWVEPVEYAQLLIAASRAIRAVDPDAAILTAALAPTADRGQLAIDEVYFLQRMIAAGAAPWFDAVAIQPFGFGHAPGDSRQSLQRLNFQRAALIRRAMIDSGTGSKPIWAVRFGWNSRPDSPWATVSTANQQRYLLEAIQFVRSNWQWFATLGWAIDQPDAPKDDPMWGFALTEELAGELGSWGVGEKLSTFTDSALPQFVKFFFLVIALFATLWRFVMAVQQMPWQQWHFTFRTSQSILLWTALLVVYHFANWAPLIGLCWLLAAGLIALNPQVGVWLAAVTLPFYFQHKEVALVDTVLTVPPSLALTLCFIPKLLSAIKRNSPFTIRNSPFAILALGWLLINLLSGINVWNWDAYGTGLLEISIQPLLLYLAIRLFIRNESEERQVLIALIFGGVMVAGYGLFDWLRGGGGAVDGVRRLVGPYFSPNHAALFLLRTLFLAVGMWSITRPFKIQWLLVNGLIFGAMLLTASRGALLLGLPTGALLWLNFRHSAEFAHPRANRHSHVRWAVGAAVTLVAITFLLGWDRLANSATMFSRLEVWRAAFALWQQFPLLGVGADGFFWNYPAWLALGGNAETNLLHPHNLWLEFATNWGIFGLLWLMALLVLLWRSLRSGDWLSSTLAIALLAALAHAQVDTFTSLPDLAAWNWIVLGLLTTNKKGTNRG